MFIKPKNIVYMKTQRKRIKIKNSKQDVSRKRFPRFGSFALFSLETSYVKDKQIESTRKVINNFLQRRGQLWVNVFTHKSFSSKPAGTRIGKGKGLVSFWAARVYPGIVLFELSGVSSFLVTKVFKIAQKKLPIKTKISSLFLPKV